MSLGLSFKIDLHTHILPRNLPDLVARYGYGGFVRLEHLDDCCARLTIDGQPFREIDDRCWNPERRLEDCARAGVDVQVLSTVPVMFSYWADAKDAHDLSRLLNDDIAATVAAYPTRFVGLGTLPMQDPDLAARELERCLDIGLAGVEIGTNINGWNLDQPEVVSVLAHAASLGAAVFVHPWDMLGRCRMERHWLPWLVGMPTETALAMCSVVLGGVLEQLPDLRIAFAHGGGSFPSTFARIERGFEVRPDLCATQTSEPPGSFLKQMYVDSLVHDERLLRGLIELFGVDRVALGSDYPFPLGEDVPGALIGRLTELERDERDRLQAGSALEFLGLDRRRFEATEDR